MIRDNTHSQQGNIVNFQEKAISLTVESTIISILEWSTKCHDCKGNDANRRVNLVEGMVLN